MSLLLRAITPVASAVFLARSLDAVAAVDYPRFMNYGLLYIAAYVLETIATTWSLLVRVNLTESVASVLRRRFVQRTMNMPLIRYDKMSRGDLVSRLTSDVNEASRVFAEAHIIISTILRAVSAVGFLIVFATRLGAPVIVALGLAALINSRAGRPIGSAGKEYQASLGALSSYALNAIEGHAVVKAFSAQGYLSVAFSERVRAVRDKGLYLAARVSGLILGAYGGASVTVLVVFGYGAYLTVTGRMTVGAMIASLISTDYISPLGLVGQNIAAIKKGIGAYVRVKELTEAEVDADLPELPVVVQNDAYLSLTPAVGHVYAGPPETHAVNQQDASVGDALIVVRNLSYV